ncbi:hypothetical protein P152DRAFT_496569 [Eremomyces bilateralis CBS 781.70]|uniref:S-adenosyl-L-methionine-dependent methyltransferase n=1 Tax=Eremomyces bilateralis CBS 781.70 TaxID=1392243 RepID=A0A6G1GCI9_9PEZI|nr:uncharacterized protein P152DRAFT_496569 [Eremomyces bilateralis CBS 781.70]KAF1815805.1 hypothetical protein P152DRAFT_496569 [Eremomyces bilateralis CBS 781.70]
MITVPHHQHLQPPPLPQLRPPHIQLPSVDQLEDIPRLSVTTPNSPLSITDFLNAYGDRNTQSSFGSPSHGRFSSGTKQSLEVEDRPSVSEDQEETGSMGNLRFGALMTSKWLSFGRVLFSPAHYEVQERSENRVLILDGLGKDWSYYAALTYPNATIYSLGPDPTIASPTSSNPAGQSPTNHRHIHHPYPNAPFPFPRGFFACAVFRFPQAVPDSAYSATLSECKRVLRPGGYLEVFALDLDLLNMGNRARRAVRSLKERMQFAQPGVSLKPVADNLMRCVGRRGFEGLQRCVVGVPISGPITRSMDESGSGEEGDAEGSSGGSKGKAKADEQSVESDASDGGDANITKMVARVGRWWYTQCYESGATSSDKETGQSIWDDRTLLRECERRGTNFRLLICYAQKPMVVKRRTVSV